MRWVAFGLFAAYCTIIITIVILEALHDPPPNRRPDLYIVPDPDPHEE